MLNRPISFFTVAILYATSVVAEEPNTIYIPSDNIVPYQAAAPINNTSPAPQTVSQERAPYRVESPTSSGNPIASAASVAPAASHDNFAPPATMPSSVATPDANVIQAPTQTHLWMKLQSSGAVAGTRYKTPGQTATQIYQRYLKSFTHPIPERFNRSSGGSGSGSGSGSSSMR